MWPIPATQRSAAAWKMSVPTIFAMVSGYTRTITRPKNVPLPTEVRPTTKPNTAPMITASTLSRVVRRKGASVALTPRLMNDFARNPRPPATSAAPTAYAITSCALAPYSRSMRCETQTPRSDIGPEPRNIHRVSRAWTVPSRRCRTAPNDLKIAPWRMSVPTAYVGLNPNRITRIGVISEPPPMPVRPTIAPISRPVRVNCQVTRSQHHAGGDGVVRRLVDQDERARLAGHGVPVDRERLREPQPHDADVVQLEALRRRGVLERPDVDDRDELVDDGANGAARVLHGELRTGLERALAHPADAGLEVARHGGRALRVGEHVAARDVDVVREPDRHGFGRERLVERAVGRVNRFDAGAQTRREHEDLVARPPDTAGDAPRVAAVVRMVDRHRPDHPLHRERAGVGGFAADASSPERFELAHDLIEAVFRPLDKVHLVDGDGDVRDAQDRGDVRVAARLLDDAVPGVDQDHRHVGCRRAGDHVARVLDVARRVGELEAAARRHERPVGDVDRDPLLALGAQSVREEGEVDVVVPAAAGRLLDVLHLVDEDLLRVVEQTPDQRRLAVVDRAARDEPQELGRLRSSRHAYGPPSPPR